MSGEETGRENEKLRPKEGRKPGEGQEPGDGAPEKGASKAYNFKFKPADPKNDLEFEDMADK